MRTYEWDEAKSQLNYDRHSLDFDDIGEFDWATATVVQDSRQDYGEERYIATGLFLGRLTVLVFTIRGGNYRIISWRKANEREQKAYGV